MLNLTSGGMDNGARPICEARAGVEENWRTAIEGTRKIGIEVVGEDVTACRKAVLRVVENIVVGV